MYFLIKVKAILVDCLRGKNIFKLQGLSDPLEILYFFTSLKITAKENKLSAKFHCQAMQFQRHISF